MFEGVLQVVSADPYMFEHLPQDVFRLMTGVGR